jgi:hypothetical protein
MAEFNFHGTHADRAGIVSALLSFPKAYVIPDGVYSEPKCVKLKDPAVVISDFVVGRKLRGLLVGSPRAKRPR